MVGERFVYRSANHAANLNSMRLNNKWCDVTIKVNKREIRAHKVILAANLKYFDIMLSNNSFQESKQGIITMADVKGVDLKAFVSYAYTGEILLKESNALGLLELANYLGEDGIKEACIEFLKKHLRKEEACRAYKFSDTISCLSLKSAARQVILLNFMDCSQTAEYLNFDYEDLMDIFPDGKGQPTMLQQKYFEGIMRWIMCNMKERRIYMNDLLNSIDMAKLLPGNLIGYLYGNIGGHEKELDIKDVVMSCYHASKNLETKRQQLIIMSIDDQKLKFQFCNLARKKWSHLQEIPLHFYDNVFSTVAILNDELYYIGNNVKSKYLSVFSPITKRNSTLQSSSRILRFTTLCASREFVYLFGGKINDVLRSSQVLRYDPQTNSLEKLAPMGLCRSRPAVIFYQGSLHVMGGWDGSSYFSSVERYNPDTKEWMSFPSMCEARSNHAVTVMDGKLYVCGGLYKNSVEVYDPSKNSWQLVDSMNKQRYDFVVIVHEGKLFAIGGDHDEGKTAEVYDPHKNEWTIDHELSTDLQIKLPQGGMISSNYIANVD